MEATPGDSGEQGQSKGLFLPRELSASWCFVLFCLLVFDILIASSSMTTRSPGLHCPAPPGPARPRQATAAAPRSQSFLCCAHRAGCDAASFCLGNGMCLSNVCSGVLQVEGDGQPESPRSPSATPLPSSADLGEEVRARRALPRNCPPRGPRRAVESMCVLSVCRRRGASYTPLHAGVGLGCGDVGSGTPCLSRGSAVHPCSLRGSHTQQRCVGRRVPPRGS